MEFSKGMIAGMAIAFGAVLAVNPPSKRQIKHAKRKIACCCNNMMHR